MARTKRRNRKPVGRNSAGVRRAIGRGVDPKAKRRGTTARIAMPPCGSPTKNGPKLVASDHSELGVHPALARLTDSRTDMPNKRLRQPNVDGAPVNQGDRRQPCDGSRRTALPTAAM